ncbi:ABC transporter permease [Treponema pedis]|uniref:ABC transporter permease n=1 Tax=Treponema pedis TaxID=409322 RepID=UPI0004632FD7|nr:ABC transporter permease [Treponema pedis]
MKRIFFVLIFICCIVMFFLPLQNVKHVDLKNTFSPVSGTNFFGTDHLGRDIYSLIVIGFIRTITVVITASSISFIIGIILGLAGGFCGKNTEMFIKLITDMFLIIPSFIAALIIASALGLTPITASLAIGISDIGVYSNQAAILTKNLKNAEFIQAEKILGIGNGRVLFKHILPNILPHLFTTLSTKAGGIILQYASLTFIGLGADITNADWGTMLYTYRIFIVDKPVLIFWPAAAIFILASAFHFLFDDRDFFKG